MAVGWLAARAASRSVWPVLLGAVLPDLIDKPLWALAIVAGTRGVGHSVVVWLVAAAVSWRVPWLRGVALGGLTHLAADVVDDLLAGVFHTGALVTGWWTWPLGYATVWAGWSTAPVPCAPCWHAAEAVVVAVAVVAAVRAARVVRRG